ncbi:cytochrome P450 [Caldovatus sediminis]|uniref:Cytochrome P450 n=1 Tax=Caldovatus sediminis TaxID=2041189 RepID=A0A8J2Z8E0_9PROT|nr:cytochrome P450 [Caldovatus sediminis]GGG22294.1 cytochrome P450 [Caldovatus sediminis]
MSGLRFVPPPIPERPLAGFALLDALRTNVLRMWPREAYEAPALTQAALGRPILLLNEPEAVRRVLVENEDNYTRSPLRIRILRPVVRNGLLLAEGEAWRHARRIAAPAFSPRALPILARHFALGAQEIIASLEADAARGAPVDLLDLARRWSIALSGKSMFSLEMSDFGPRMHALMTRYIEHLGRPFLLDVLLPLRIASPRDLMRRRLEKDWIGMLDEVVERRLRTKRTGAGGERDLLDLLREARDPESGAEFSREQLRDQVATMLVAGQETTTSGLFWTIYLLALHPALQERIAEEAAGLDLGPDNAAQAFQQLAFTRAVFSESLRLYPPVFMIVREAKAEDQAGSTRIAPGATVMIAPWVLHRHRHHWQEPEAFDPARFLPGAPRPQPMSYLPFGMGPRVCIGALFATALSALLIASIVRRFRIALASTRPALPVCVATCRPDHAPAFRLQPRGAAATAARQAAA